jgi:hypothetical protein
MLRLRLELLRLWRAEVKSRRHEHRLLAKFRARDASKDEIKSLREEYAVEQLQLAEDRAYLYHRALEEKAGRLSIPLPERKVRNMHSDDEDEFWKPLFVTDRWILNRKGVRLVRQEIREELKARREHILGWITPFIGILSTVLGTLVGYWLGARR